MISDEEIERHRQAAYLYSIIQSAENSEGGGPETIPEIAFDAGILYAARCLLENWAGDNEWTVDLYEYADEIRSRTDPGHPLPQVIAYRYEAPNGEVLHLHPSDVTVIVRGPEQASRDARRGDVELASLTEQAELVADLAKQPGERVRVRVPCARCGEGTDAPNTLCPSCARRPGNMSAPIVVAYQAGYGQGRDDEAAGLPVPDWNEPTIIGYRYVGSDGKEMLLDPADVAIVRVDAEYLRQRADRIEWMAPGFAKIMRRTADEMDAVPAEKKHGSYGLLGYESTRCANGLDGCDDKACICRCHADGSVSDDG